MCIRDSNISAGASLLNSVHCVCCADFLCLHRAVSLTFTENTQAARNNSSAILPVEPLKAFISKIKVIVILWPVVWCVDCGEIFSRRWTHGLCLLLKYEFCRMSHLNTKQIWQILYRIYFYWLSVCAWFFSRSVDAHWPVCECCCRKLSFCLCLSRAWWNCSTLSVLISRKRFSVTTLHFGRQRCHCKLACLSVSL